MSRTWNVLIVVAVATVFAAAVVGCGKGRPKTVPVTGTVTFDGKPVEGASVAFYPAEGGRPATGTTDAQGKFTLTTFESGDGALPGSYNVTVMKVSGGEATADEDSDTEETLMGDMGSEGESLLPPKYANVKSSGLTVEVKAGMEPVTLQLTSK